MSSGVHPASDPGTKPPAAANEPANGGGGGEHAETSGVSLTAEQVEKLGLETQPAESVEHAEEVLGYGVVLSHESVAQAVAEVTTARATERLSRLALARARQLAGTPGAVSTEAEESAAQKAQIDATAMTLATQKLTSTLGMHPPWKIEKDDPVLRQLASGAIKLVRVTFPLGVLPGGLPTRLRAAHLGLSPGTGWTLSPVWGAPADASVPGRSFFSLLRSSDAEEGERLEVWAPAGPVQSGVLVPAAAVVLSEGKYWCYVEKQPHSFSRVQVDTSKPTPQGYFVTAGIKAGDRIVTTAVGQLLAKETGSSAEPD
jgi:hypothetical protein